MATTTNYGWTTPDDTALVKDGASAIRSLGSSIDTTVKNLNPETTLGDISYRSSTANTNTRLAIGSSGQVLTVSGGVPTWAAVASGGLTLLSTTTLSGTSTSISISPSGYQDLQIYLKDFRWTSDSNLSFTLNNDTTTYNYIGMLAFYRGIAGNSGTAGSGDDRVNMSWYDWVGGNNDNTGVITIYDVNNTATGKAGTVTIGGYAVGGTGYRMSHMQSFAWLNTNAVSSIQIKSNNSFTGGSVEIYGVK